ncbi:hypothetical protein BDV3_003591 [Batrachochytrium dendrobatidis]
MDDIDRQFNADLKELKDEMCNSDSSIYESLNDNLESGEVVSDDLSIKGLEILPDGTVSTMVAPETALESSSNNSETAPILTDRGIGSRYFVDMSTIVCRFCRRQGHMFKDCKEKETRCHLCREDHDPLKCPLADLCYICFQRGHQRGQCPTSGIRKYCVCCTSSGHSTRECTRVWRQYKYTRDTHRRTREIKAFCYMCGEEGHFGDNCTYGRSTFRSSAFHKSAPREYVRQGRSRSPLSRTSPSYRATGLSNEDDGYEKSHRTHGSTGQQSPRGNQESHNRGRNTGNRYNSGSSSNRNGNGDRGFYDSGSSGNHNRFNVRDRRPYNTPS